MIKDITFFCQIVITDAIFSYEKWSFIDFLSIFSYGSSSISMIFVFWWITLNEYITREWKIYIIFQSNDLDS